MAEELAAGKLLLDEPAEAVARLRINNPAKRNALDHDILDALAEVLPWLDRGIDVRCVVITGSNENFSAGYDIGSISEQSLERDARALVAHPFNAAIEALADHPWPTVAAISGDCLGGGLELAITCDLRICAGEARLGMPPAKLGLIYGHTGLRRFLDAIGLARTKEMFLTASNIGARRAREIGLVQDVVGEDELEQASVELAERIAANAPLALKGNKLAIETLNAHPVLRPQEEVELIELRESSLSSEDFREAITAFAEKRKAGVARSLKAARAELAASDPVMAKLIERLGERSPARRRRGQPKPDAYGALLRTIVGQQLSSRAARTIYERVLDLFGGKTPSPKQILAASESDLRGAGLSGRKVEYIRDLAAHMQSGELKLDHLEELSDEEVIEEIVAVRGLGRWSAEMFLLFHLERPDIIAGGDLGIRKAVQLAYGMDEMPTPDQVEEIGERWSPNRSLASIYLWESLADDVTVGGV